MMKHSHYFPAFHFYWLMRWYDPMMRHLFHEEALKTALINQAHIQSGQTLFDMDCGTGMLMLMIKQTQPSTAVYGLYIDSQVLDIP